MSENKDASVLSSQLKAWFLGPKAENEDFFEKLILDAFRDYCYWRRNFHPEDEPGIRASDRRDADFEEFRELIHDRLFEMVSHLKRSAPGFSPRYLGHMMSDLLIPGVVGYVATMLYNQNNIYSEASTITLQFESEALKLIARMLHLDPDTSAWGHLCSGGTGANLESMWIARSVRFFPYQLALALENARGRGQFSTNETVAATISRLGVGKRCSFEELVGRDQLANLRISEIIELRKQLSDAAGQHHELGEYIKPFLGLGLIELSNQCHKVNTFTFPPSFKVLLSTNAHYSLRKSLGIVGLGESNLVKVKLDSQMRLDSDLLHDQIHRALHHKDVILGVVGVYGSTEEGAIDDFAQIVALRELVRQEYNTDFWLHGDACYGGYALAMSHPFSGSLQQSTEDITTFMWELLKSQVRGEIPNHVAWTKTQSQEWTRHSLALGQCDSVSIDPHKLGYIPYPAGAVFYRDYRVREFIRYDAPYLNISAEKGSESTTRVEKGGKHWEIGELGKYTLEGSRPGASGAAIWLAHKTVPLDRDGHGRIVAQSVLGARYLQATLEKELQTDSPSGIGCAFLCENPDLNILCYTFPSIIRFPELNNLEIPSSLAVLNRAVTRFFTECLPTEERPTLTREFVVSMTSLSEEEYGGTLGNFMDRLHQQGMIGQLVEELPNGTLTGNPWRDDSKISVIRTVVMSPFLLKAMTRPKMRASRRELVHEYADFLQTTLGRIFKAELGKAIEKANRPVLTGNVMVIENTEETLVGLCDELRRVSFQADPRQVVGMKTIDLAWEFIPNSDVVLIDSKLAQQDSTRGFQFLEKLRDTEHIKGLVVFASDPLVKERILEGACRRPDWTVTVRQKPDPLSGQFQAAANLVMADVWDCLAKK
ncbi:MAG TPA: pyridoxal-dependent decarboxylase [Acidobacteriota bacterium]|nr:pyridoxal-dependent decarboxylase [Acidobacteriota bacterium]HNB71793.1 pyridoxal-dependent decarboxylase [Acidobacteriota bacterium]HNG92269.1 pyridoxal-dependent decarboxylase [Acidobacteriota bacterium]HNH82259.1 pyridoxal-dependent decarboxylase [Acidobacteriota bacterium]